MLSSSTPFPRASPPEPLHLRLHFPDYNNDIESTYRVVDH